LFKPTDILQSVATERHIYSTHSDESASVSSSP